MCTAASVSFIKVIFEQPFWDCLGSAIGKDDRRCHARRCRNIGVVWTQPKTIAKRKVI